MTFEEYALARGAPLMRFARLLTVDEHRAEDLVQEVLAKAYVQWRRVSASDRPDVYVRRMMVNAHHSWWRRRSNRELPVPEVRDTAVAGNAASRSADRDELWQLVVTLPPRQRTVIVLRYYEDFDDATIAEVMNCSPGTVRTQAKRALATLQQKHLSALCASEGGR